LDAELALNADFAKVTGKTIGTVSGLEYSYTHANQIIQAIAVDIACAGD
jgi:translation initiation factor 1 (eIF-1/SUI1)